MNGKEFRANYNNFLESGLTLWNFCANQGSLEICATIFLEN